MEAPDQQDVMVGSNHSSSSTGESPSPSAPGLKRKRTKRRRALSSPPLPVAPASSSSTSSADFSTTTEEEEDMAHCLILLAQGRTHHSSSPPPPLPPPEKFTSRKFTQATTTAGARAGFYVYECKTCNRCFPSFQALGGHRASHKKPKVLPLPPAAAEDMKQPTNVQQQQLDIGSVNALSRVVPPPADSPTGNKTRVHECSICGAEFSSGQALGGHMRRHRPIGAPPELPRPHQVIVKNERNLLSLDLNLPAPSDENSSELQKPPPPLPVAFPFKDKRPMVFSPASALVDCHY